RQIERRETLDGQLPRHHGLVRKRDTEASFRKAVHAVLGVDGAFTEHTERDHRTGECRARTGQPEVTGHFYSTRKTRRCVSVSVWPPAVVPSTESTGALGPEASGIRTIW